MEDDFDGDVCISYSTVLSGVHIPHFTLQGDVCKPYSTVQGGVCIPQGCKKISTAVPAVLRKDSVQ